MISAQNLADRYGVKKSTILTFVKIILMSSIRTDRTLIRPAQEKNGSSQKKLYA